MRLAIITAHAGADSLNKAVHSWLNSPPIPDAAFDLTSIICSAIFSKPHVFMMNGKNGILDAYETGFQLQKDQYDIIAFLHDDCIIHEKDWVERVLHEFEDPKVGLIGFGGATRHGSQELYKIPFDFHQLGRSNFLSNMDDAESHGKRFTGACDVAVLDGFSLIFRTSVLDKIGGWHPESPAQYIAYDYAACCRVRRAGYRIRLLGIPVHHLGGRTYVKLGLGDKPDHWEKYLAAHRYIYDEFKDVLPYEVTR